jgi:hypothetical protein
MNDTARIEQLENQVRELTRVVEEQQKTLEAHLGLLSQATKAIASLTSSVQSNVASIGIIAERL